jgi:spermidine synthase
MSKTTNAASSAPPWLLHVVAFMSGGAVLAIEILGTRMLGPFYGVTLFLWSALITVTLVALSLGYTLGGRRAEGVGPTQLAKILALAGAWLIASVFARGPIIGLVEPMGLRASVLAAAVLLFGAPLTLLGAVSPILVHIKARQVEQVGRAAGDLYAISTVGGVVAALGMGFVLIPSIGVQRLAVAIGASLCLVAIACWIVSGRRGPEMIGAVLFLLATAGGLMLGVEQHPSGKLLALEQSPYGEIRVVDDGEGSRHLLIDGGVHSSVVIGSWQSLQGYIWVLDLVQNVSPVQNGSRRPREMLLLGLGAGSSATSFSRAGWGVRAVEIDPQVTSLAQRHFGLTLAPDRITHADARAALARDERHYDAVVLDAFSSNSIPFHLFTVEAFALVRRRLVPGGVFALNVESRGWRGATLRAVAATLWTQFDHVIALPLSEDQSVVTNVVLLASDSAVELQRAIEPKTIGASYQLAAWARRFEPPRGADVLTDDRSPVDIWSEELHVESRQATRESFAQLGLAHLTW